MKLSSKLVLVAVGALFILSGCAATTTSIRQHPDFAKQERPVTKVAIVTPDIQVHELNMEGENPRLAEREKEVCAVMIEEIKKLLSEKGYLVSECDWVRMVQEQPALAEEIQGIQTTYQATLGQMYGDRTHIEIEVANNTLASVGPVVNPLADAADADAILLTRFRGQEKSGGVIAKDFGTSVLVGVLTMGAHIPVKDTRGMGSIDMALIDGVTGEILWSNIFRGAFSSEEMTAWVLSGLPKVGSEKEKK